MREKVKGIEDMRHVPEIGIALAPDAILNVISGLSYVGDGAVTHRRKVCHEANGLPNSRLGDPRTHTEATLMGSQQAVELRS